MPDDTRSADVERILSEEKALEDRKQTLIDELLKQKEAAIADFDGKLAKLGYQSNPGKSKRSHHKKAGSAEAEAPAKPKAKG